MLKRLFWLGLILFVLLVACASCFFSFAALTAASESGMRGTGNEDTKYLYGDKDSRNLILSIKLDGVIMNDEAEDGGIFSTPAIYGYQVKQQLYAAAENDKIKAVILEINSPGGTIVGSKAISDGVEYYREKTNNPVIAHVSGMAASGGYWVASATDYIIADTGSISGSIGVIFGPFTYYDKVLQEGSILGFVGTENGIENYYITGGEFKDIGNPYRRISADELAVIQEGIDSEYDIFVEHVAATRNLTQANIRNDIKALFYANKQALELKLIDEVGSKEDAYAEIAERASLGEDYKIIREESKLDFLSQLLSAQLKSNSSNARSVCSEICSQPLFLHGNPASY